MFRSAADIVLALTEELGEVATEVALLERVGTKTAWTRDPDVERLRDEISHLRNLLGALAEWYNIA
jgi:NTP pyrophosphatase (non-canonical NTP hydrolase)